MHQFCVLLTFAEILSFFKQTDLIIDDCSDFMLCFQSFLDLGMSNLGIQRHIILRFLFFFECILHLCTEAFGADKLLLYKLRNVNPCN